VVLVRFPVAGQPVMAETLATGRSPLAIKHCSSRAFDSLKRHLQLNN